MSNRRPLTLYLVLAVYLGMLASAARGAGVVGDGTPEICTDAALAAVRVGGGNVRFDCGSFMVSIPVDTHGVEAGASVFIDGENRVILEGEGSRRHFYVPDGGSLRR